VHTTRSLALAAVLCAVVVSACSHDEDTGEKTAGQETIGAQLSDDLGQLEVDRAPSVAADDVPPGAEALWSVEFDSSPHVTQERLVGLVYPDASEPELSIVGIDGAGKPRWRITTNPSCAGFGVTRHDDRDMVIVLDSDADVESGELATRTTATAFDAHDGSVVWGPVDVPGPLRGPGLIFGEAPGSIVADETGPRVMLTAADGSVVADETAGDIVYYEHHGVGVLERDGLVQARHTATEKVLWTENDLAAPPGSEPGGSPTPVTQTTASVADTIVLAWPGSSGDTIYSAHDLGTGALVDQLPGEPDGASVADPTSSITLMTTTSSAGRQLVALGPAGIRWAKPFPDDAGVDVIAGNLVYGRAGTSGVTLDLVDGASLDEGGWAPPTTRVPTGPAVVQLPGDERQRYVAVSLPDADRLSGGSDSLGADLDLDML